MAESYWDKTADLPGTVARLAGTLSKHQPFRETNHRTAHTIAHRFLIENGFDWMAPSPDDRELEDILAKDRDWERSLEMQVEELTLLFRERMRRGGGSENGELQESHGNETSSEPDNP